MSKAAMGAATAALLVGAAGVALGWWAHAEAVEVRGETESARIRAESAEAAVAGIEEQVASAGRAAREAVARVAALEAEVARLREDRGRPMAGRAGGAGGAGATGGEATLTAAAEDADAASVDAAKRAEFESLRDLYFRGQADEDQQARFWQLARTPGLVDGLLKDLESAVEGDPGNVDARMDLASGYVAKLFTVPAGPEMGLWAVKAEGQWKTVLEQDAEHWDARFALGTSWSRYPEFLNKTPDAIKQFETLRKVQEARAPEAKHGQTYVQLHLLHLRQGNEEKAREALETGLRRHPEDEEIRKSLESLK